MLGFHAHFFVMILIYVLHRAAAKLYTLNIVSSANDNKR